MGALLPALSVAPRKAGAEAAEAAAVTRKLRRDTRMVSLSLLIKNRPNVETPMVSQATSLVRDRRFFVYRIWVGELQPEAHHLFVAGFAPANGFRGIGILRIVERIVEVRGGHQLRAFGQKELVLQKVGLLPPEVIVRHIENYFVAAIGIDGFGRHAFPAKV